MIYTPFLRSKIKNVWKILHDFRVSQFNCSLWTSPQSHIFNRIEFFQHLLQEDITLKKYRCVLRVACKSSVPSGRFDNMISTRNVQVMDILCEAEGVPKAWNFYFFYIPCSRSMNAEVVVKKWDTYVFWQARISRLKTGHFQTNFALYQIPNEMHLWDPKQWWN